MCVSVLTKACCSRTGPGAMLDVVASAQDRAGAGLMALSRSQQKPRVIPMERGREMSRPLRFFSLAFSLLLASYFCQTAAAAYLSVANNHVEATSTPNGTPVHREIVVVRNDSPCRYDSFNVRLAWLSNNNVVLHSEEVLHERPLESGAELSLTFDFPASPAPPENTVYASLELKDHWPIRVSLEALWISPDCSQVEGVDWDDLAESLLLAPAEIEHQLGTHAGIRACFEQTTPEGLTSQPPGNYRLVFTIERTGLVSSVFLQDPDLQGGALEKCLRAQVRETRWPSFAGKPKTVKYPYLWKPPLGDEPSGP